MAKFIVQGGRPLKGSVRIGGAKNAGFKLMIASLLLSGETRLLNLSRIGDVEITAKILTSLGARLESRGERTIFIKAKGLSACEIPLCFGKVSRTAPLFVGPLLARFGRAVFPLPGGDPLGSRPIERFLAGWEIFGCRIKIKKETVRIDCPYLKGGYYRFAKPTHTGTEAMIMTAVLAKGKTILENAALEPEVDDLIKFLNNAGAKIKREPFRRIKIEGVKQLGGVIHSVMPDRNEAVSYACAALATRGDVIIENARVEDMKAFLDKVKEAGGKFAVDSFGIRFWYDKRLRASDIITRPHPGFMSDWQPLWTVLMTQAKGTSRIVETVHNFRFHFANDINRMGGKIEFFNPEPADPETFYNFTLDPDQSENFHGAKIIGPTPLEAVKTEFADIRAGATLTIAALIAKGKSILKKAEEVDRGYEDLDGRLRELGAKIKRVAS
ncbi:MAG: UDP-N-acetylglucosamine 1-carboxyvinyltransferase [Candidatus Pacebacteria bacterium]|nr:UDP-N-acetylglucosamine 1-carboxyvinyltransferase [Candidatus Paceibacterota bacterium]